MKKLLFAFVTLSLMLVSCRNSDVNANHGVDKIKKLLDDAYKPQTSDNNKAEKSDNSAEPAPTVDVNIEKEPTVDEIRAIMRGDTIEDVNIERVPTVDVNIEKEPTVDVNIEMVHVNGGEFRMGGTDEQGGSPFYDEFPIRNVYLNEFYIGKYEVTQGQWEAVMGNNPSKFKHGSNYPVENVTWYDAQSFCRQLSKMTGKTYRLPTEAEWEYAACGGDTPDGTKYSGNDKVNSVAWHKGNSGGTSKPVGMLQPNGLGIYDMSGNIWEWVSDWWSKAYDPTDTYNPKGASTGSKKVVRGGSWYFKSSGCRISSRSVKSPNDACSYRGFRVVMEP